MGNQEEFKEFLSCAICEVSGTDDLVLAQLTANILLLPDTLFVMYEGKSTGNLKCTIKIPNPSRLFCKFRQ